MTAQSVQVQLELGHTAHYRKQPTEQGYTHDWHMFLRGPDGNRIQNFVEKVVFHLHDSFNKPRRVVKEPPYEVKESGYAGFLMPIDVYFKNKEEPRKLEFKYDLFLNGPDMPPVNYNRSEKLRFQNPSEEFRRKLIKGGGVGVPSASDYAVHQPENANKSSSTQKSAPPAPVPPETSKEFSDIFGAPIKPEMHKKKEKHSSSSSSKEKHKSKSSSHSGSISKTSSKDNTVSKEKYSPPKEKSSSKRAAEESSGDSAERKKKRKEEKKDRADKSDRPEKSSDKSDRSEKSSKEKSKSPKDKEQALSQSLFKSSDSSHKKDLSSSQSSSKSSKSSSHKSSKKSEKNEKTERTESLSSSKGSSKQSESEHHKTESPKSPKQKTALEPLSDLFSEGSSDEFDQHEDSHRSQSSSFSSMMEQFKADSETLVSPIRERPDLFSESSDESPEKESPKKEKEKKRDKEKNHKHHEHKSSSSKKDKKSDKRNKDSSSKEKKHRKEKQRSHSEKSSKKVHTESPKEVKSEPSPVKTEPSSPPAEEQKFKPDNDESNMSKTSTGFTYEDQFGDQKKSIVIKQEVPNEECKKFKQKISPLRMKEENNSDMSMSDDNEEPPELELRAPNGELMSELKQMYAVIMGSRDTNLLQKIVDVIEETGMFVVSDKSFDFDLCKLDSATVVKIKSCIQAVS